MMITLNLKRLMIIPKSWEKKPKREAKGKEDAYNKTKTM